MYKIQIFQLYNIVILLEYYKLNKVPTGLKDIDGCKNGSGIMHKK